MASRAPKFRLYVLACSVAFWVLPASSVALSTPGNKPVLKPQSNGARLDYETRCSSCHGLDGRGGERAPDIATNKAIMELPDREVARIVYDGRPSKGMPGFDFLGQHKIQSIVSYVRTLGGKSGWKVVRGDPERGRKLFFGKDRCGNCHMVEGRGGFLGSDLSAFATTHAPDAVKDAVLDFGKPHNPHQGMVTLVTSKGDRLGGVVRNEDNFSLQLMGEDGTFHNLMKSEIKLILKSENSAMFEDCGRLLTPADLRDLERFLAEQVVKTKSRDTKIAPRAPTK